MFSLMLAVTGCVAIVAIYFLWVRKLPAKAPEQAKTPDARS
jgi:hypothetical protein